MRSTYINIGAFFFEDRQGDINRNINRNIIVTVDHLRRKKEEILF